VLEWGLAAFLRDAFAALPAAADAAAGVRAAAGGAAAAANRAASCLEALGVEAVDDLACLERHDYEVGPAT
jgi:hypothetical protein